MQAPFCRVGSVAVCVWLSLILSGYGQTSIAIDGDDRRLLVEEALARRSSIDVEEVPLVDVAGELSQQFDVQIVVAMKKLEEASVSPQTPVTCRLKDLSLESILRIVLKAVDLTFTVQNEVLLITTPEDVESDLEVRVYPVQDLQPPKTTLPKYLQEFASDALIDLIVATIRPDSWDDVGGPGAIDLHEGSGVLVVTQTREIHCSIEQLLTAMRRARSLQGIGPAVGWDRQGSWPSVRRPTIATKEGEGWQVPQVHAAGK